MASRLMARFPGAGIVGRNDIGAGFESEFTAALENAAVRPVVRVRKLAGYHPKTAFASSRAALLVDRDLACQERRRIWMTGRRRHGRNPAMLDLLACIENRYVVAMLRDKPEAVGDEKDRA